MLKTILQNLTPKHIVLGCLSFLAIFLVVTSLWLVSIFRSGPLAEPTLFVVEKGASLYSIARDLEQQNIIRSGFNFKLASKILHMGEHVQAGAYHFNASISLADAVKKVVNGDVATFKVTIPEGLRTHEVLGILKNTPHIAGDFSKLDLNEKNLLLPETYVYTYGEDVRSILSRMNRAMEVALNEAWASKQNNVPLKSKMELLTLASIVEKETAVDSERGEVAGVFVNRLNKRMKLQTDPTVIFGIKNYDGNIRRKHLRDPHPYNTYVHRGLPPGPIAHPGKASLMAAANPNDTENLFFVADMKGGHVFAKTLKDHNKNVKAYLEAYKARYGSSN